MVIDLVAALLFPVFMIGIPVAAGLAHQRAKAAGARDRCWSHRNRMPAMLFDSDPRHGGLCPECRGRYYRIAAAERDKEAWDAWWDEVLEWRA